MLAVGGDTGAVAGPALARGVAGAVPLWIALTLA